MLGKAIALFAALMLAGTGLTLVIFRFDLRKFRRSSLATKILMWIPIFGGFLVFAYSRLPARLVIVGAVIAAIGWEYLRQARRQPALTVLLAIAFVLLAGALGHFIAVGSLPNATAWLLAIGFASAISDVFAFFAGTFAGRHKLPAYINANKSYEGVLGQLVGAFVGICLVRWLISPAVPLALWLPVGLGAALGDLANSYLKRRAGIKDWSNAVPGHGGYADRFASLAGSVALAYWWQAFL